MTISQQPNQTVIQISIKPELWDKVIARCKSLSMPIEVWVEHAMKSEYIYPTIDKYLAPRKLSSGEILNGLMGVKTNTYVCQECNNDRLNKAIATKAIATKAPPPIKKNPKDSERPKPR